MQNIRDKTPWFAIPRAFGASIVVFAAIAEWESCWAQDDTTPTFYTPLQQQKFYLQPLPQPRSDLPQQFYTPLQQRIRSTTPQQQQQQQQQNTAPDVLGQPQKPVKTPADVARERDEEEQARRRVYAPTWNTGNDFPEEWKLSSGLSQSFFYNDNLLLETGSHKATFGSITAPEVSLQHLSPTTSIGLSGAFPFTRYFERPEFNSDNQYLNLNIDHMFNERNRLDLLGGFQHTTTLTSDEDVTGRELDKSIDIYIWSVNPSWTYQISPTDALVFSPSYRNVHYDSSQKTSYEYYGGNFDYSHQLNTSDTITGSVGFFRYAPDDDLNTRTDIIETLLSYTYRPSDRLLVSGGAGVSYNMTRQDDRDGGGNSNNIGYRLKFDFQYSFGPITTALLSLSHDTEPSSEGAQVTRNRVDLTLGYKLTDVTSLSLTGSYVDNEDHLGLDSNPDLSEGLSNYMAIGPAISWQIVEDMKLTASYQFQAKVYKTAGGTAYANAVFLTLSYALPDFSWGN